jgi:hypothetical protein
MEEVLLVGVLWEVTMLDKELKKTPFHVEISLGNFGNMAYDELQSTNQQTADSMSRMFIVIYLIFKRRRSKTLYRPSYIIIQ